MPFGTLRDQLPDRLAGEEANAVVASVVLCHGIPHEGDKLLYNHYSNRPWAALFEAQRKYREHLAPVFNVVPDLLVEHDPLNDKIFDMWMDNIRDVRKATMSDHPVVQWFAQEFFADPLS